MEANKENAKKVIKFLINCETKHLKALLGIIEHRIKFEEEFVSFEKSLNDISTHNTP